MKKFHNNQTMHVESISLKVKDLKKMRYFYKNTLGLDILLESSNKIVLGVDHPIVTLIEDSTATSKTATTGLYHFAILLPERKDLSSFLRHMIEIHYPLTGGSDHGVSEAIYLNDPEGNGIEVYWDKDESDWPKENGKTTMFTEFLDYEDLLTLSEHTTFTKLPKNTILGHLHLHVRNLNEAKKFFVDMLGFNVVIAYGPSALFISDNGYHHHIGLNTWNGTNISDRTTQTGLVSYQINVPNNKYQQILNQLISNKITYREENDSLLFNDLNQTLIELKNTHF
ncbi:Glyoxalase/bleomycin resistance protein/dioxygenase-related protein [Alteracholeplasma palmae J233]|uniref:Glyoxalase/bleomycin resistance protein/dioxygenase-related protein n=1 Tax=Alteracholeplasma palmae (strain ATCC 49389 / J233) TaxID=1318466 RepID=U4KLR3_ALTPJ|nr:VOC family protein [Alteracholeplasma palmae]CCV64857.1 Glyoxalase/bleomycin resistance protein/dioxygenase-related protein [Alteracholeplasma palmae J233]